MIDQTSRLMEYLPKKCEFRSQLYEKIDNNFENKKEYIYIYIIQRIDRVESQYQLGSIFL